MDRCRASYFNMVHAKYQNKPRVLWVRGGWCTLPYPKVAQNKTRGFITKRKGASRHGRFGLKGIELCNCMVCLGKLGMQEVGSH
jgi:hypothetical protein